MTICWNQNSVSSCDLLCIGPKKIHLTFWLFLLYVFIAATKEFHFLVCNIVKVCRKEKMDHTFLYGMHSTESNKNSNKKKKNAFKQQKSHEQNWPTGYSMRCVCFMCFHFYPDRWLSKYNTHTPKRLERNLPASNNVMRKKKYARKSFVPRNRLFIFLFSSFQLLNSCCIE